MLLRSLMDPDSRGRLSYIGSTGSKEGANQRALPDTDNSEGAIFAALSGPGAARVLVHQRSILRR
jgi:hypothetical protein